MKYERQKKMLKLIYYAILDLKFILMSEIGVNY